MDGSKLPDYEMVRHYLNPAGMQITSEKDGWFLKGFTLNMEAVKGEQAAQSTPAQAPAEEQAKGDAHDLKPRPETPAEAKTPAVQPATSADHSATPQTNTEGDSHEQAELQSKQAEASTIK